MTYLELYEQAERKLEHNEITVGEFDEMIKPLKRETEALEQPQSDGIYETLRILDAIHSSGRMNYNDYSQLHDAILEI